MSDIATRLGNTTTGQLLVRSGIEIERVLNAMLRDGTPVTAKIPDLVFLSRLLAFDSLERTVLVAYSDHKPANSAVLAARSVTMVCNHRGAQYAFACKQPRHCMHAGQPAIRMAAPPIMLAMQHRHGKVSGKLPGEADVECELRMGVLSFDAKLVDMSLDGHAFLLGAPAIPLCAGTRLQGAKILDNLREPVIVDIEVDQVIQAVLPDGRRATRIGGRVLADRQQMERLTRLFVIDLQ
jgi:c-di-GMP-binding flagellar brake protein YcgR